MKLLIINFLSKFKPCFHSTNISTCLLSHPAAVQLPEFECFPRFEGAACRCSGCVRPVVACAQLSLEAWPTGELQLLFSDGSQCFTRLLRLDSNNLNPLYSACSKCSGNKWNKCPWYSILLYFLLFFVCFSKWKDWRHQWLPKKQVSNGK